MNGNKEIRKRKKGLNSRVLLVVIVFLYSVAMYGLNYEIVDTGQERYFDNLEEITEPEAGDAYFGQDANYAGNQPDYTDNGDGTITDNVTGLMWTKTCDTNGDGEIDVNDKLSYEDATNGVGDVNVGGYTDWRIPTIKEQYSLIMFSGIDPSGFEGSAEDLVPFINTDYFDFGYGDTEADERLIDAQMLTSTLYAANEEIMFGVNFADGRIKGYGTGPMPGQTEDKLFYIYYVRGNSEYGVNDLENNNDGTISDNATGLMWSQGDSGEGMNWGDALEWVQQKNSENYLGYSDWRLPDVKELQSIVDYTRSPDTSNSAAIDEMFACSSITNDGGQVDYPYYWSGTTHENWNDLNGGFGSYVSFGRANGWMEEPPMSGNYMFMDVHGAGAQRSDPKSGDPEDYPYGNGPQGDVVRINNYVRLVRDFEPESASSTSEIEESVPEIAKLSNYPNPFNPSTTISYDVNSDDVQGVQITIFNLKGQCIKTFDDLAGSGSVVWNGTDEHSRPVASGVYYYTLEYDSHTAYNKMLLVK